ncbi:MAG: hypothetical protein HY072_09755 [Deltaproteobacteria bacterium]|nr:hypothetical protein [Deltaproteobacteria bacterium]
MDSSVKKNPNIVDSSVKKNPNIMDSSVKDLLFTSKQFEPSEKTADLEELLKNFQELRELIKHSLSNEQISELSEPPKNAPLTNPTPSVATQKNQSEQEKLSLADIPEFLKQPKYSNILKNPKLLQSLLKLKQKATSQNTNTQSKKKEETLTFSKENMSQITAALKNTDSSSMKRPPGITHSIYREGKK